MKRLLRSRFQPSPLSLCLAACAALLGVACEGVEPRDLGSTSAPITLDEPFRSDINEFAGRWVGSAEDILALNGNGPVYQFPSGSTQIVLDVAGADGTSSQDGPVAGSIRFGEGDALPAPTDPDSGYPAGVSYDALLQYGGEGIGVAFIDDGTLPPFEGVDYPISTRGELISEETGETTAADGVVSFTFSANQPLDAWCQLQTPQANAGFPEGYSCLPSTGGQIEVQSPGSDALCGLWGPPDISSCEDPADFTQCIEFGDPVAYVNCDKVFLCKSNDYCTCSAEGCSATYTNSRLTVRRVGDELVGVFQNTVFLNDRNLRIPLGEVRLQRVLDE
ncbi:MAG TPA: hypothetical protein VMG12_11500 [Polyangiaceae bacterium]|nr:hypothetical protein [Polyangiaceae bacterium]